MRLYLTLALRCVLYVSRAACLGVFQVFDFVWPVLSWEAFFGWRFLSPQEAGNWHTILEPVDRMSTALGHGTMASARI